MRGRAKIVAMAASLAVLAGAWFLAESMARDQVEEEKAAAEPEEIRLSIGTAEELRGLSWNHNGEAISLVRDGETAAWVNEIDEDCPIDQAAVEPLVKAAADVKAGVAISNVTDFEQYGLAEPAMTVTVTAADRTITYDIGGQTLNGECYVRVDGSDTVYTETGVLLSAFEVSMDQLLAMETAPEDMGEVTALSVKTDVAEYELRYTEESTGQWNSGAYNWFVTQGEDRFPLTADRARELYGIVTEITFTELVEWHGGGLAEYGLDAPQGRAAVTYTAENGAEKSFALEFGEYTGSHVYVRIEGSDRIYTVAGTVLDRLMYPDWKAMMPLDVFPADLTSVTGARILLGGHTYDVEIITEEEPPAEGDGGTAETVTCYVSNGWTLDFQAAEAWFEMLTALEAESTAVEVEGREELLNVTLLRDDETRPEVTLIIWSYDSGRCLCEVNGEAWYFVSRADAETLVLEGESLLLFE